MEYAIGIMLLLVIWIITRQLNWKIIPVILLLALLPTQAEAVDSLRYLNVQRAHLGLGPLRSSPRLQAKAEWAAYQRGLRGLGGHLLGRPVAGRWEGTAKRNSRRKGPAGEYWGPEDVYACYQSHRQAQYAGCASVLGRDGFWYYQLNLDTRP